MADDDGGGTGAGVLFRVQQPECGAVVSEKEVCGYWDYKWRGGDW